MTVARVTNSASPACPVITFLFLLFPGLSRTLKITQNTSGPSSRHCPPSERIAASKTCSAGRRNVCLTWQDRDRGRIKIISLIIAPSLRPSTRLTYSPLGLTVHCRLVAAAHSLYSERTVTHKVPSNILTDISRTFDHRRYRSPRCYPRGNGSSASGFNTGLAAH